MHIFFYSACYCYYWTFTCPMEIELSLIILNYIVFVDYTKTLQLKAQEYFKLYMYLHHCI